MSVTMNQVRAVVEFAKANGFPTAKLLLWDDSAIQGIDDIPGHESPEDAMDQYGPEDGIQEFTPGLQLNGTIRLGWMGNEDEDNVLKEIGVPGDATQAFRAAFPPGPANTTPANMADLLSRMDPAKLQREFAEHVRTGEPMPAPTTEFQRDTLARGEMAERLRVAEAEVERLRAGIRDALQDDLSAFLGMRLSALLEVTP